MMSTTLCLRIGSEDSLHQRYPKSFEVTCGVDDFNKGDAADQYLTQRYSRRWNSPEKPPGVPCNTARSALPAF